MIAYILKSSLSLIILFGLYWFLLRREKLFRFNRFYLIFSILFSLVLPFISIPVNIQTNETHSNIISLLNNNLPAISSEHNPINDISKPQYTTADPFIETLPPIINLYQILLIVYIFGLIISLFRFTKNILKISRQIKMSESTNFSGKKLVLMDHQINPYCFFNTIFVYRHDYLNNKIAREFLMHELEHIRQSHSIDIIFLEFIRIIYWFNPILFLYSRAIRANHEFLADSGVLRDSLDIEIYTDKLLSLISNREPIPLTSGFSHSLMKGRLLMITKPESKNINLGFRIIMTLSLILVFSAAISFKQSNPPDVKMVFIPQGHFNATRIIGTDTIPDALISVGAFYMSNEITNKEYREFTDWAKNNPKEILSKPKYVSREVRDPKTGNMRDVVFTIPEFIYISEILPSLIDSTALYKLDKTYKNYFTDRRFDNYPVVGVSKKAAEYFCLWKTKSENMTNIKIEGGIGDEQVILVGKSNTHAYRLPLEMEWEYVAQQPYENQETDKNYNKLREVNEGKVNLWELSHLEDNISEWVDSPQEKTSIVRGGSWNLNSNTSARQYHDPNYSDGTLGFRIVQSYIPGDKGVIPPSNNLSSSDFSGSWELNLSKSTVLPGINSSTLVIVHDDNDITITRTLNLEEQKPLVSTFNYTVGDKVESKSKNGINITTSFWGPDKQTFSIVENYTSLRDRTPKVSIRTSVYSLTDQGKTLNINMNDVIPESSLASESEASMTFIYDRK